jgi:ADP-ribose pyrophosphatase YjhB (NUDIX family)
MMGLGMKRTFGVSKHTFARLLRRTPLIQTVLRRVAGLLSARFTVGVVGVVLDDEGRILLLEHVFHPRRPWGLPGGWLEAGEPPQEGVRREIVEETGLEVEVLRPLLTNLSRHSARHLDIAYALLAQRPVEEMTT